MRNKIWMVLLLMFWCVKAQNVQLLGQFSYEAPYHDPTEINDCWGFEKDGRKYALVGLKNPGAFSILEITDPQNISEVYYLQGPNSTWRDVKVYQDYAYVVNEEAGGLDVFDLSQINSGVVTHHQPNVQFTTAHNIFIDTAAAYLLVLGPNLGNGGVLIYDISQPLSPDSVGFLDQFYVHDAFMRNDTVWSANVLNGHFAMYRFNNGNPILLGVQSTTSRFTHNIWPDDSGDFVFTTDEISGAYVEAYDVRDNVNYELSSKVKSSAFDRTVPHNVYYIDGFLYTSFYGDGLRIFDAEDPYNLIESGKYDTYPGESDSYDGAWGIYPYGNGDTLIISDQNTGLWVFEHQKERARKIHLQFKDASSQHNIQNVQVKVLKTDLVRFSDALGRVRTGIDSNFVSIAIERLGYDNDTLELNLSGDLDTLIYLNPLNDAIYSFNYTIKDKATQLAIPYAQIRLKNAWLDSLYTANQNGEIRIEGLLTQLYDVTFGAWGYQDYCLALFPIENRDFVVELESGYECSFEFDFNMFSPQKNGDWESANVSPLNFPNLNNPLISPAFDTEDCGRRFAVTQMGNINLAQHQLNPGEDAWFITPPIVMPNALEVQFQMEYYWVQMMDQIGAKDSLKLYQITSNDTFLLDVITSEYYESLDSLALDWQDYNRNFITNGKAFKIGFQYQKSNLNFRSEIYLDHLEWNVLNRRTGSEGVVLFPNPYYEGDELYFGGNEVGDLSFKLYNAQGQMILDQDINKATKDWKKIELPYHISSGYYLYSIEMNGTKYDGKLIIK